jgi:hypothetical protein
MYPDSTLRERYFSHLPDWFKVVAHCKPPCCRTYYAVSDDPDILDCWRFDVPMPPFDEGQEIRQRIRLPVEPGGKPHFCPFCGTLIYITAEGEPVATRECTWADIDRMRDKEFGYQLQIHRLRTRVQIAERRMTPRERMGIAAQVVAESLKLDAALRGDDSS